jgi:glycosyltransferase involved in cell wall biosynthesis
LNPDLLHVLPKNASFLPYGHIDLNEWSPLPDSGNSRPLVVHAPSNRVGKGTRHLLAAVGRLKAAGFNFDFMFVEGMNHVEARQLYERADLVVDQLLAGWYGGFSVEMMALGKPVICYLRREDFKFLPIPMWQALPLIEASPNNIESVLSIWLKESNSKRRERGMECRRFVETWHDPKVIAQRLIHDYTKAMSDRYEGFLRQLKQSETNRVK